MRTETWRDWERREARRTAAEAREEARAEAGAADAAARKREAARLRKRAGRAARRARALVRPDAAAEAADAVLIDVGRIVDRAQEREDLRAGGCPSEARPPVRMIVLGLRADPEDRRFLRTGGAALAHPGAGVTQPTRGSATAILASVTASALARARRACARAYPYPAEARGGEAAAEARRAARAAVRTIRAAMLPRFEAEALAMLPPVADALAARIDGERFLRADGVELGVPMRGGRRYRRASEEARAEAARNAWEAEAARVRTLAADPVRIAAARAEAARLSREEAVKAAHGR